VRGLLQAVLLGPAVLLLCLACHRVGGRADGGSVFLPEQVCPNSPDERVVDAGTSYSPVTASSGLSKVKNLLTGLSPADGEMRAVAADPSALKGLVRQWRTTAAYQDKMLGFFETAFQQNEITWEELTPQFSAYPFPPFQQKEQQIRQNLAESFGRTALELISDGAPFTSTMTTRRFMMTPALMALYAALDAQPVPDYGAPTPASVRYAVTLEGILPFPQEESFDPESPRFLTFFDSGIVNQPPRPNGASPCPDQVVRYPAPVQVNDLVLILLSQVTPPFVYQNGQVITPPPPLGDVCTLPGIPDTDSYVHPTDFTDWRMVTIRQPGPGESPTPFYDLPAFRSGSELVMNVPRVGFFTTLSFLGQWSTNQSNLARVTANQTLITALGVPIDQTNSTAPHSLAALDSAHAPPGTACYGCHQSLDPMRQFFRQAYSLNFSVQGDAHEGSIPGQFAFHGVSLTGASIFDLGDALAGHPFFAKAWVQKLCTWANGATCDQCDPEFQRIVSVFVESNFSWNALVDELFSSPLVTNLADTATADAHGEIFPIARQAHLCALLSNRLGIPDACGLSLGVASTDLQPVHVIASSWPSDAYGRGSATPVLANAPSLFTRAGLENICTALATHLIDNPATGQYASTQPESAMQSFVTGLMGLTSDRAPAALSILEDHFSAAQSSGATASDALKSTFVLACVSPYVAGIGI
jgi:hypothetical protein